MPKTLTTINVLFLGIPMAFGISNVVIIELLKRGLISAPGHQLLWPLLYGLVAVCAIAALLAIPVSKSLRNEGFHLHPILGLVACVIFALLTWLNLNCLYEASAAV